MSIISNWEDYDLPNIRIGKSRNQENGYQEDDIFNGPFFREKITDDVVTTWDCSIICDRRESRRFRNFMYDIVGVSATPFYIPLKTERSKNLQLVRIISGLPQPKQVASNAWEYSFILEALDFNFESSNGDVNTSLPENYVRTADEFTAQIRGLATGTPSSTLSAIKVSMDRKTVIACTDAGGASISRNIGGNWQTVPVDVTIGTSGQNAVDAAISDDGLKIAISLTSGYTLLSKDNGRTWYSLSDFGVGGEIDNPSSIAMSGDGDKLIVVSDVGDVFITNDFGENWQQLDNNFSNSTATTNGSFLNKVIMNKAGDLILATSNDGYVSISINGGSSFSEMQQNFGFTVSNNNIRDIAMSESGAIIYVVGGNDDGTEQFFLRSANFGSTFSQINQVGNGGGVVGNLGLYSVTCTPNGEYVYVSGEVSLNFGVYGYGIIYEIGNFGLSETRRPIKSEIKCTYTITIENNTAYISNVSPVKHLSTDGQSYFAAGESGYSSKSIPKISDLDYDNINQSYYKLPEIGTEITSDISGLTGYAGQIRSMCVNEKVTIQDPKDFLYVGMSDGFLAREVNSIWESINYSEGDIKGLRTNYKGDITLFQTGFNLIISYDNDMTRVDQTNALESVTGGSYFIGDTAMSNDGKYIMVSLIGEPGLNFDCISDDYGQTFNLTETGFSGFENSSKLAMSNDGKTIFAASSGGRLSVSFDYGKTFTLTERWQNSDAGNDESLTGLCCSNDGKYVYATYSKGYMARSTTSGMSWLKTDTGLSRTEINTINDVACSGDGQFVAIVMDSGRMIYSSNYGETWVDFLGSLNVTSNIPASENLTHVETNGKEWFVSTESGRLFYGWSE